MHIVNSVVIAFSMFSRIPMPHVSWNNRNMRYTMAFFPLIGVAIGLIITSWAALANALSFSPLLRGAGFTLLPALLSGGIHLDGFCDTVDALASHASKERRQEILQDPHIGAFAAIGLAIYLIAFWAFSSELSISFAAVAGFAAFFTVSRSLSGLAVVFFPCAKNSGLARTFSDAASKNISGVILTIFAFFACFLLFVFVGVFTAIVTLATALITFFLYYLVSKRKFGGISGDLAGWFLQLCELAMLAALVIAQKLLIVWHPV